MLGGMLAGHNESGGEVIEKDGKVFRSFYGMSSKSAMDKYSGGVAKYRAAEGKTVYLETAVRLQIPSRKSSAAFAPPAHTSVPAD